MFLGGLWDNIVFLLQSLQGEEEQIESEFKAVSKTAQNLVKDSPQPVINDMLAELKEIKDRLLKVQTKMFQGVCGRMVIGKHKASHCDQICACL